MHLLPGAKVRLISKHKQIKANNTQSWFYSNHHTDSTAHRGYTTHPTLGVLGLSVVTCASCSLLSFLGCCYVPCSCLMNDPGWAWRIFNIFSPDEVMGWRCLLVAGVDLVFSCLFNHDDPLCLLGRRGYQVGNPHTMTITKHNRGPTCRFRWWKQRHQERGMKRTVFLLTIVRRTKWRGSHPPVVADTTTVVTGSLY